MDDPFIADPAQAVLVVRLVSSQHPNTLVVVRTEALIELACSPRADSHVPWDEWGEGAAFITIPKHYDDTSIFIHGTKVMVMHTFISIFQGPPCFCVHTIDLSRRGRFSLPPLNEEAGGTEIFRDGWSFGIQASEGIDPWSHLKLLGDGSLFYMVGPLYRSVGSKVAG